MGGGVPEKMRSFPWKTPFCWGEPGEPGQTEEGNGGRGLLHRVSTTETWRGGGAGRDVEVCYTGACLLPEFAPRPLNQHRPAGSPHLTAI